MRASSSLLDVRGKQVELSGWGAGSRKHYPERREIGTATPPYVDASRRAMGKPTPVPVLRWNHGRLEYGKGPWPVPGKRTLITAWAASIERPTEQGIAHSAGASSGRGRSRPGIGVGHLRARQGRARIHDDNGQEVPSNRGSEPFSALARMRRHRGSGKKSENAQPIAKRPAASATMVWRQPETAASDAGAVSAMAGFGSSAGLSATPAAASLPAKINPVFSFDAATVDRLADDVMRKIDRRLRVERERRGI